MNLLEHKKARLNYEVLEEFEAGLQLLGHEVKAVRAKHGKLEGSHVIVRAGEAYIVGCIYLPTRRQTPLPSYDPDRTRKLLLTKKELAALAGLRARKGLTIVPISVYNKGNKLKVKNRCCARSESHDKRAVLKERDTKREIQRTLKNQ
jgi:SsrA-binding protein